MLGQAISLYCPYQHVIKQLGSASSRASPTAAYTKQVPANQQLEPDYLCTSAFLEKTKKLRLLSQCEVIIVLHNVLINRCGKPMRIDFYMRSKVFGMTRFKLEGKGWWILGFI
jgi:hypothetical protein